MSKLSLVVVAPLACAALLQTGCQGRLTPDEVREKLDHPTGRVSPAAMGRATLGFLDASHASAAENFASLFKGNQVDSPAPASGIVRAPGVSYGAFEDAGDVFCGAGLVAGIASFDGCESGQSCNAELTLDSCLLRIGDSGNDEDARGKIVFKVNNSTTGSVDQNDLSLSFEGWRSSRDDTTLDAFDGLLALSTTDDFEASHSELILTSDLDLNVVQKNPPLFDDGIVEHTHAVAGLRFMTDSTATSDQGSLEILSFVDEDGGRDESLTLRLAAESHQVDASTLTSSASLEVVGENGTFSCTWGAVEASSARDGETVHAEGECIDENGETFSFSGSATES